MELEEARTKGAVAETGKDRGDRDCESDAQDAVKHAVEEEKEASDAGSDEDTSSEEESSDEEGVSA